MTRASQYISFSESLANLNTRKSAGPDELSPKLLKLSAPVIVGPLSKLFNHFIISSVWPSQWKPSHVTPVCKKEDEAFKLNYRPISNNNNNNNNNDK